LGNCTENMETLYGMCPQTFVERTKSRIPMYLHKSEVYFKLLECLFVGGLFVLLEEGKFIADNELH